MKRVLVIAGTLLALLLPTSASAAGYNPLGSACGTQNASGAAACSADGSNPISGNSGILRKASLILATIGSIIAVIIVIIGGFRYVTSGGDSGKAASARGAIVSALVGLVIIAAAESIVVFVVKRV